MKLISVVIPVYNVSSFLKRCLDSVIEQSYSNLEIILIDDGSTDDSGKICDRYSEKDQRIIVIHQRNGGLSAARNSGIKVATGEYITFIDSDDWIETDYILYLAKLLEKFNADFSQCSFNYIDKDKKIYNNVTNTGNEVLFNQEDALTDLLLTKHLISSAWGKLYRRDFFNKFSYPEGKLFEDIPVTYDIVLHSNTIVFGDRAYYNYFYNTDSISKASFNLRRLDVIEFIEEAVSKTLEKYPKLYREAKVALFRTNFGVLLSFKDSNDHPSVQSDIYNNLKVNRRYVIFNSNVSFKEKIKAFSTYFGKEVIWVLFKR